MRTIFVLHSCGFGSGGIRVVLELVSRLAAQGHPAELWHTGPAPAWFPRPLPSRSFPGAESLKAALRGVTAIKIATWWETAYWVAESLKPGDRGAYLVQDIETTYTNGHSQDTRCLNSYRLGLTPLATSQWVADQLRSMKLEPRWIGLGIDFDIYKPFPCFRDRSRLMVPCRRFTAGPRDLKGWHVVVETIARLRRLAPHASAVTFGIEGKAPLGGIAHLHFQSPSDKHLRELYAQAGVFFMPSRHEGFGLTAAEAMACGCPVVATRAEGNEEFCLHEETCFLVPKGDTAAAAEAIARLMQDEALAERLGEQGHAFIQRYSWATCLDRAVSAFSSLA